LISNRHPVVEYFVFGLAGLLALVLAYHGYARWAGGRRAAAPEAPLGRSAGQAPETRPQPAETQGSFHGGGALPTVRFSEPRKRSRR
jgi:hypothetical protein